jgi:hypothetical protein
MHYWDFEDAVEGSTNVLADTAGIYAPNANTSEAPLTPVAGSQTVAVGWSEGIALKVRNYGPAYDALSLTNLGSTFTMETRFRWNSAGDRGWARVMRGWGGSFSIHMGNSLFAVVVGTVTQINTTRPNPNSGDWVFLAVVADGEAGTVTAYAAGPTDDDLVAVGTSTNYSGSSAGPAFRLGDDYKYTGDHDFDHVAVWSTPLSKETLRDHWRNGLRLTRLRGAATLIVR